MKLIYDSPNTSFTLIILHFLPVVGRMKIHQCKQHHILMIIAVSLVETMPIQNILDNIATDMRLEPQTAEHVVGIIFSIIEHEAPDLAGRMFGKIPGAQDPATTYDVLAQQNRAQGGLLATISEVVDEFAGDRAGALLSGIAELQKIGLDAKEIRQAGAQLFAHIKQEDEHLVEELEDHMPGLKKHFGS